jgi:catechol 2,3-dioxygenase-like lactoylglutathione lyase family enzyme
MTGTEIPAIGRHGAKLWHMGLTVSDIEASVRFYTSVVGLTVEHRQEERSADFDELSGNTGTRVSVAWLTDGACVLQLIQYRAGGDGALSLRHARVGTAHLSFYVSDVDATFAALRARGDVALPPSVTEMGTHGRSFYVYDPDGVPVELWESVGAPRDRFNRPLALQ